MTPEKTTEQAVNEKVGIGAYLSLAFAVVFFSGLCASSQWWGVFDFTTVNGGFGRLVSGVTEQGDAIKTAMANFRGKGGSGAIDGFMFALSLVPTVMFALAMITVFEHYGALKAARKILTPVLRPLIGIPGSAALALIASMQSTDGGAALTRQLKDAGELTESETNTFAAFQMTADAPITRASSRSSANCSPRSWPSSASPAKPPPFSSAVGCPWAAAWVLPSRSLTRGFSPASTSPSSPRRSTSWAARSSTWAAASADRHQGLEPLQDHGSPDRHGLRLALRDEADRSRELSSPGARSNKAASAPQGAGAAFFLVRSEQPVPPRTRAILIRTTLWKEGP